MCSVSNKLRPYSHYIQHTGNVIFDTYRPGHLTIHLPHLAIPTTIRCFVGDTEVFPDGFDLYGHPYFKNEESSAVKWNDTMTVNYQLATISVARDEFDTVEAIKGASVSLDKLNELLNLRKLFAFANPDIPLNEFFFRGYFLLDAYGGCIPIGANPALRGDFDKIAIPYVHSSPIHFPGTGDEIPPAGCTCNHCGKQFTAKDIPCVLYNGTHYHKACSDKLGMYSH